MKQKLFLQPQKLIYRIPLAAIVLLMPLFFRNFSYGVLFLCLCEMYIIAANGLDILYGYSGQISFGTSAFFGLGAYGSLLLHKYAGIPVFFTMFIAAAITCLIAMIFAYPVSKLRFAFLSLATIAFNQVVYQLITRSPGGITGDFNGTFTEPLKIFGLNFKSYYLFYYFGLICVVVFVALKMLLVRSRVGRAFLAVKQNTHAADGMGIDVRKYKIYAFGVYGFYTAFAGAMYVHLIGYVSPETVQQSQSVIFMIMLLFGGVCSDWGPVVGAVGIMMVQELLSYAEQYQLLAYGILLLIFILFLPRGVVGEIKKLIATMKTKKEASEHVKG